MATRFRRHVLLCADTDREGCASEKRMRRAWKHLEKAVEDAGLAGSVICTRTRCLDLCEQGPILVVYPDGVWYGGCEPDAIDRIVKEHLEHDDVVERLRLPVSTGRKG